MDDPDDDDFLPCTGMEDLGIFTILILIGVAAGLALYLLWAA